MIWRGILADVVGVIAAAWPGITIGAFIILFAVYTFVAAGMDDVATGVVALAWPGIAALALVIWVAAWALVTGVAEIALASTSPEMQVNVPCSD